MHSATKLIMKQDSARVAWQTCFALGKLFNKCGYCDG